MEKTASAQGGNPLGEQPIGRLLLQYAIPSIISTLIGSLYNMMDQVFIGQRIGYLGNAATTVAYPLTFLCGALTLLFSNGAAVNFNILNGRGKKDEAMTFGMNGLTLITAERLLLGLIVGIFTPWFVNLFGSTEEVFPYALTYMRIIAIGVPFLAVTAGGTLLIRSDGSPRYALICSISGVALNFVLDYLFLYPLNMGIAGAALATILGQILSAVMVITYMFRFKTGRVKAHLFLITGENLKQIVSIGAAPSLNQAAMMVMNLVLNSALRHYGALSVYGGSEALAAAGVVTKVNFLFYSTIIGCGIGGQPILGFNYGSKKYRRVTDTYFATLRYALIVGAIETVCFWVFPHQILQIFGSSAGGYEEFAILYMHVFMLLVILAGIPPISMHVMTSVGKAKRGIMISLSKQLTLIVLLLFLPLMFDIKGVLYAGPVADFLAAVVSFFVLRQEFRRMWRDAEELHI
ncbi:MATE family efflux transporter [Butyrivibrio sp. WCE2006]|uniref:MATE family efflux transporter n=1 Tax=Butyrivibrio sp. WCE2006 TaxID=1410611 RepID=UPI0005D1833F|nr:MATE family efflux transporter [Butyrivibrio sp. WCE2006]